MSALTLLRSQPYLPAYNISTYLSCLQCQHLSILPGLGEIGGLLCPKTEEAWRNHSSIKEKVIFKNYMLWCWLHRQQEEAGAVPWVGVEERSMSRWRLWACTESPEMDAKAVEEPSSSEEGEADLTLLSFAIRPQACWVFPPTHRVGPVSASF